MTITHLPVQINKKSDSINKAQATKILEKTFDLSKKDNHEIDPLEYMERHFWNKTVMDVQVFLTEKKLPIRLVALMAPEDVVNKRRREARATAKKQGRMLTDKTLRLMSLTIFITNVLCEIWKPEIIFTIYRVRWQIELIFKCWKSRLQIKLNWDKSRKN